MKLSELKSCPFCGGEAQQANDAGCQAFTVYCTVCDVSTPRIHHYSKKDTPEKAIKAWNRRAYEAK